ncbi:hypothetical protein H0A61_00636 [Koleobacter methoxysyntrophicus]|uniref:Uncharacterized protein n=1 Tax=Koleobacter methoxysyntrophicus TaxID=2751313 RepID=A0A8A0RKS7_9FIRM|nr:hypothetical protein H0A61_00636 [Koleobacter methoxysyntrophicus]
MKVKEGFYPTYEELKHAFSFKLPANFRDFILPMRN